MFRVTPLGVILRRVVENGSTAGDPEGGALVHEQRDIAAIDGLAT